MKNFLKNTGSTLLLGAILTTGCSSPTAKAPAETTAPRPAAQAAANAHSSEALPPALATTPTQEFGPLRVPVKTVGILLYDGFTPLDAMAPAKC